MARPWTSRLWSLPPPGNCHSPRRAVDTPLLNLWRLPVAPGPRLAEWGPEAVIDAHGRLAPEHLELARHVGRIGDLDALAASGASVVRAAEAVWSAIDELLS